MRPFLLIDEVILMLPFIIFLFAEPQGSVGSEGGEGAEESFCLPQRVWQRQDR